MRLTQGAALRNIVRVRGSEEPVAGVRLLVEPSDPGSFAAEFTPALTDEVGIAVLRHLPPGLYDLRLEHPGYARMVRRGLSVSQADQEMEWGLVPAGAVLCRLSPSPRAPPPNGARRFVLHLACLVPEDPGLPAEALRDLSHDLTQAIKASRKDAVESAAPIEVRLESLPPGEYRTSLTVLDPSRGDGRGASQEYMLGAVKVSSRQTAVCDFPLPSEEQ
jgi:hypothetical protein